MKPLVIAIAFLVTTVQSDLNSTENWKGDFKGPLKLISSKIKKREVSRKEITDFKEFVEDKLVQHSQALEHLLQSIAKFSETLQEVMVLVNQTTERLKIAGKKVPHEESYRRSNYNIDRNIGVPQESPLVRLSKNVTRYGRLAQNLFLRELLTENDPPPLIEGAYLKDKK